LRRPAAVYGSVNKLVHSIFNVVIIITIIIIIIIIILHQGHKLTVEEKCGVKTLLSET
jgi:hypothetical protein